MEVLNLIAGYFGGWVFPLHKPYPYSLYRFEDSSILGTWTLFGNEVPEDPNKQAP